MNIKRIVFAGGPGTGKTTVIRSFKNEGYYCFEEVSRQITKAAQEKGITQLFLQNPLAFSQELLKGRIEQFKKAEDLKAEYYFYDRGIPEVLAYMNYKKQAVPEFFYHALDEYKYDLLFYFPIWEQIYKSDNERYESLEEAKAIDPFIRKIYQETGYSLIEVPKTTTEKRKEFILNHL